MNHIQRFKVDISRTTGKHYMTNQQQPSYRISPGLIVGAVVGLLIGLLIGWVIWPVEWQGAKLSELYPEAKADYLVAVAEAYTMYGSPEAAAVARQRVAPFGDALGSELESAIAEVSKRDDPDKAVRISNLNSLAAALDVPLNNLVGFTQAEQQTTSVATPAALSTRRPRLTASSVAATTGEETSSGGIGWLGWLLGLLVAVALVLGGVYSLLLLSRRNRQATDDAEIETVIDDRFAALKADDPTVDTASSRYVAGGHAHDVGADNESYRTSAGLATVAAPYPGEPEEYQFDDDPEDYSGFPAAAAGTRRAPAGHYTQFSLDSDQSDLQRGTDTDDDELWAEDNRGNVSDNEEDNNGDRQSGVMRPDENGRKRARQWTS